MNNTLFICENCIEKLKNEPCGTYIQYRGFYTMIEVPTNLICPRCKNKLKNTGFPLEEARIITRISNNTKFLDSMIKLAESDPIEYQLKLSQFKVQLAQIQKTKEESNKIHCPKCNSTAITSGARGVNYFWGLIGASKTVNRCGNCGYTWKP